MSEPEFFPRYGSDLTVPSLTTYRFINTHDREKKELLTFITKSLTSFRQDWPVEVTQTEDTVTVWIARKLAFNYEDLRRTSLGNHTVPTTDFSANVLTALSALLLVFESATPQPTTQIFTLVLSSGKNEVHHCFFVSKF
ncbi:unnamed protein product [Bemisia tabaci]|uniref:Uncharacterized protein n=1 Tax=Bemisia tabaci TaxID=7038 RepID=A0A9P0F4V4_BEMTA|nr:unnamed protein product [Bemisia tabaci]